MRKARKLGGKQIEEKWQERNVFQTRKEAKRRKGKKAGKWERNVTCLKHERNAPVVLRRPLPTVFIFKDLSGNSKPNVFFRFQPTTERASCTRKELHNFC